MVEFLAGDDGLLVVNAYGGPGRGTLLLSDEMEFQRFAENLLQVGGDLLGACKEASDSSSDQDSFESSLHRLALEFGLFDPAEGD